MKKWKCNKIYITDDLGNSFYSYKIDSKLYNLFIEDSEKLQQAFIIYNNRVWTWQELQKNQRYNDYIFASDSFLNKIVSRIRAIKENIELLFVKAVILIKLKQALADARKFRKREASYQGSGEPSC